MPSLVFRRWGSVLVLAVSVVTGTVYGQDTAKVAGRVTDAQTGEPVEGVSVQVRGTTISTRTGADGRYELAGVPVGRQDIGFISKDFDSLWKPIALAPDQEFEVNGALTRQGERIDVRVQGERPKGTEEREIEIRTKNDVVGERIGSEEISRQSKDTQGILQTLPGVTVVDRFPTVRGLGGRYSATRVNGNTLPSPEPERKVVPIDLFPSNILRSLSLIKSYSADLPGEFAGGSVELDTLDVPFSPFFKVSVRFRAVNGTTYERFNTYEGGRYDRFTFDDGTRELPSRVPSTRVPVGLTDEEREAVGESFTDNWETIRVSAPLDHKMNVSFGQRWETAAQSAFGIVGTINWSNSYLTVTNETREVLSAPIAGLTVDESSVRDTSTFSGELNGLLNVAYDVNPGNRIGIRQFVSRSNEDSVRLINTIDTDNEREFRETDFQYVERRLYNTQVYGNNLGVGQVYAEWRASYSRVERDEPDHRTSKYIRPFDEQDFTPFEDSEGLSRSWLYLSEDSYDAAVDVSIPFHPFVDELEYNYSSTDDVKPAQRIQIGGAWLDRDRTFESRTFTYAPGMGRDEDGELIDVTLPPEQLLTPENINPDGYQIDEVTENTDSYDAELEYLAAYALVSFRIARPLRVNAGVRIEQNKQSVFTTQRLVANPQTIRADLDDTDILPGVTITYEVTQSSQFRVAASQTVNRPTLRELAPVRFQSTDGFRAQGNAALERATLRNLDLRWEYLDNETAELLSFSLFYKQIDKPIERVTFAVSEISVDGWENAKDAEVYGYEIEFRKKLGFLGRLFEDVSIRGNFSRVKSEVSIERGFLDQQTNDKRALQGQPTYSTNLGLFYENDRNGWAFSAQFGTFGERISRVGKSKVPDEKEQSRYDLEVSISKKFGDGRLRLTASNLFDDEFKFKTGNNTTRSYKRGASLSLSYSLDF